MGCQNLAFHHTFFWSLLYFCCVYGSPMKIRVSRGNADIANHWIQHQCNFLLSKKTPMEGRIRRIICSAKSHPCNHLTKPSSSHAPEATKFLPASGSSHEVCGERHNIYQCIPLCLALFSGSFKIYLTFCFYKTSLNVNSFCHIVAYYKGA